jgi:hypothetical protein
VSDVRTGDEAVILLSWFGLLAICYAVFRALKALADELLRREVMRDVLQGRAPAPWEKITSPPLTFEREIELRRGIYDFENEDR